MDNLTQRKIDLKFLNQVRKTHAYSGHKKKPLLILFLMCSIAFLHAMEPWEAARDSEGIKISYRWHQFGDERFREMKIEFVSQSTPDYFLPYLKESSNYERWAPGVDHCILHPTEDGWMMYTRLQTMWPFGQQDMVADFKMDSTGEKITINLKSAPDKFRHIQSISRLHSFNGSWELIKHGKNGTRVCYRMLSKTKPKIPRYLQDPIVQHEFIKGMKRLRNFVEADYQSKLAGL